MQMKSKKNQVQEEQYGNVAYRRLRDIPGYSKEAVQNKQFIYIKIENYFNDRSDAFIRCTEKQFYDYRNMKRNFDRLEQSYNKHIGNYCISMDKEYEDKNGEVTIIEYEDRSTLSPEDNAHINETITKAKSLAKDEIDIKIIDCLLSGISSDREIANVIGLKRSAIQERRTRFQKHFKVEMAEYYVGLKDQESRRYSSYVKKKY